MSHRCIQSKLYNAPRKIQVKVRMKRSVLFERTLKLINNVDEVRLFRPF